MSFKTLLITFSIATLFWQAEPTVLITQPAVTGFPKNQIPHWFANFGVVHYNKPMSFAVYATNYTLCGGAQESNLKQFVTPTFVVVKEGACSFTKKALQAQSLGAQGIVLASKEVQYADGNIVLADDGSGRKVRIAVLFIKLQDFDKLAALNNPKIKTNFQLQQRLKSSVDLFLSASGRQTYIFLRNFRPYFQKLSSHLTLNINYHTIECKGCGEGECILQNTCCAFDLDNYESGTGKFIVYEQFRQMKIFRYFEKQGKIDQWFQYMDRFDKRCDNSWVNSQQCSLRIQQELGIAKLEPMNDFDTMMEWRRLEVKTGIISLPDLSVNGIRHVQQLNAQNAFDMICSSFTEEPAGCSDQQSQPKSNKGGIIAAVIISSIVFIIAGIFCYRKIIKREITNDMSSKVDELVARYAAKVSEQSKKRKDKLMERMTEEL